MRVQSFVGRLLTVAPAMAVLVVSVAAMPATGGAGDRDINIRSTMLDVGAVSEMLPEVGQAEELILPILHDYPDVFAGSAVAQDGRSLRLFVTDARSDVVALAEKSAGTLWRYVDTVEVANSLSKLRAGQEALREVRDKDSAITALSIYPKENTLLVLINPGDAEATPTAASLSNRLTSMEAQALANSGLSHVVVDVEYGASITDSKGADSGGKAGGAAYNYVDGDVGGWKTCSYGLPLQVSGWGRVGLTAGHCRAGTSTVYAPNKSGQSTYSFGNRQTTSWPGNADIYGDFTVLGGAPGYDASIWTSNTATDSIKAAYWRPRSVDSQLCASGRSATKCRYHIISIEGTVWLGVPPFLTEVWPVTMMRYRPDHVNDSCDGWIGGDSGGAVYFSHWSGSGRVAHGLITGSTDSCPPLSKKNYYSSELWGVGRWGDTAGRSVGIPLDGGGYSWY